MIMICALGADYAKNLPEVFQMGGDDDLAHVVEGADCEASGCCEEAAESCPTEAITL